MELFQSKFKHSFKNEMRFESWFKARVKRDEDPDDCDGFVPTVDVVEPSMISRTCQGDGHYMCSRCYQFDLDSARNSFSERC